eukprot:4238092-Pleurochrysis_carterae.AAC.1
MSGNVSALASSHRKPFDKLGQAMRLIRSQDEEWPRLKYTVDAQIMAGEIPPEHKHALLFVESSQKTIAHIDLDNFQNITQEDVIDELLHNAMANEHAEELDGTQLTVYTYASGLMTPDDIVSLWEDSASTAAVQGTQAHSQMEAFLNHGNAGMDYFEIKNGIHFLYSVMIPRKAKIFRTEWSIYSRESHIAGSVDA